MNLLLDKLLTKCRLEGNDKINLFSGYCFIISRIMNWYLVNKVELTLCFKNLSLLLTKFPLLFENIFFIE